VDRHDARVGVLAAEELHGEQSGQAQIADELGAAHQEWRILPSLDRLADVARRHHAAPGRAPRMSASSRSGDSGSAVISTPCGASAWATELAMAPPQPELPPSPAPLTPRGLSGVGVSSRILAAVTSGISIAVGTR